MIIKIATIWKPLRDSNKNQDPKLYEQNDFINDKWSKKIYSKKVENANSSYYFLKLVGLCLIFFYCLIFETVWVQIMCNGIVHLKPILTDISPISSVN